LERADREQDLDGVPSLRCREPAMSRRSIGRIDTPCDQVQHSDGGNLPRPIDPGARTKRLSGLSKRPLEIRSWFEGALVKPTSAEVAVCVISFLDPRPHPSQRRSALTCGAKTARKPLRPGAFALPALRPELAGIGS